MRRLTRIAALGAAVAAAFSTRAAWGQAPAGAVPVSVARAVEIALARNENVDMAVAQADQARGLVIEQRARALPKLDFSYSYGRNIQRPVIFFNQGGVTQQISIGQANDNTFGLNLKQTLFDGGVAVAVRATALAHDVALQNLETTKRQVALTARIAYFQVLVDSQIVIVRQEALEQAERRRQVVEERARTGLASEYDRLTAEVAVENLRPPLIQAQNQLALDRNQLKRTLGISLDQELILTDTLTFAPTPPLDSAGVTSAAMERSDVVALQRQVQLRDAAISAERASAYPTLSFTVGLQRRASSQDVIPAEGDFSQSLQVGLQLGWTLFDGRASQGRLLQDAALLRVDDARRAAQEADVRLQIQQAQQSLAAATAQVEASRGTVDVARRALTIAQARFANGLTTQVELGDAELQMTQARTNFAQALFQYDVAQAQWRAALGEY